MILTTIITFIVVFGLLIFLHELGHFLTARKFGVRVEEFGFGLPPRMLGIIRQKGKWKMVGSRFQSQDKQTVYSLNWIPFGGFVKLYGEEGESGREPDSFASQSAGKRAVILSAGVAMNVLLTAVLLTAGFIGGTPSVIDEVMPQGARVREAQVLIVNVVDDSPASQAGLAVGDKVLEVDGIAVDNVKQFQQYTSKKKGEEMVITYDREGSVGKSRVTPKMLPDEPERAIIGVGLIRTGIVSYPWYRAVPQGLIATGELAVNLVKGFAHIIGQLVSTGRTEGTVSGPVGIAVLTGQVVQLGFVYLMQFTATLSLNLAILNYLPFPALDGGRVLFILLEKLRGRAVDRKVESVIHTVGFALLLALIAFITFKDIARFGSTIINAIKNAFIG